MKAVLVSIRAPYADLILHGRKTVELRRRAFSRPVDLLFIYVPRPIQRIAAYAPVRQIDKDTPENIWLRYHPTLGVNRDEYLVYFTGAESAVAIVLGTPVNLPRLIPLAELGLTPPQSYIYLRDSQTDYLLGQLRPPSDENQLHMEFHPNELLPKAVDIGPKMRV
ncbi:MAG: ASCH domain-containing protein [Deltaproteobacteria bacterium]|nr:ASCH domain-containing protein [Deltaproteobacteria bacterium]